MWDSIVPYALNALIKHACQVHACQYEAQGSVAEECQQARR